MSGSLFDKCLGHFKELKAVPCFLQCTAVKMKEDTLLFCLLLLSVSSSAGEFLRSCNLSTKTQIILTILKKKKNIQCDKLKYHTQLLF